MSVRSAIPLAADSTALVAIAASVLATWMTWLPAARSHRDVERRNPTSSWSRRSQWRSSSSGCAPSVVDQSPLHRSAHGGEQLPRAVPALRSARPSSRSLGSSCSACSAGCHSPAGPRPTSRWVSSCSVRGCSTCIPVSAPAHVGRCNAMSDDPIRPDAPCDVEPTSQDQRPLRPPRRAHTVTP